MRVLTPFVLAALLLPAQEGEESKPRAVSARQPVITAVFPMGAQPGQTVQFEVRGEFLEGCRHIAFESGDVSATVEAASFTRVTGQIRVSPDSTPGPRYFRLITPRGATNFLLIRVTRWPVVTEVDANGERHRANVLPVPALASGRLTADMIGRTYWGEEADLYRFRAKAGERVKMTVLGARNWLTSDLSLTLLTGDGRQLDFDEGLLIWDPYLDFSAKQEGEYIASVSVTRTLTAQFSRFDRAFYQIAIGNAPQLWELYPTGGRRGSEFLAQLRADFLPEQPQVNVNDPGIRVHLEVTRTPGIYDVRLSTDDSARLGVHYLSVSDESGTTAPVSFIIGDLTERFEAEPNNSLADAEEVQWPGTINGRMDNRNDQDWYRFNVTAGRNVVVEVMGENYGGSKLDSVLRLTDANGKVLAESDDEPASGRGAVRDPKIEHTFKEAGTYFVRITSIYGHFGHDQAYRLTVREARPGFSISMGSDRVTIPRAGTGKLTINVNRVEGAACDVPIHIAGLPPGVVAKPLVVPAKNTTGSVDLAVAPEAELRTTSVEVKGTCDGREATLDLPGSPRMGTGPGYVDYRSRSVLLTVAEPVTFSIDSVLSTVYLVRGQAADVGVKLARATGFEAPLEFSLENAPDGLTIEHAEIVDEGKQARLRLRASESTIPTRISDFVFIASARVGERAYREAAPKVALQLD